jgi:hypothetical protein
MVTSVLGALLGVFLLFVAWAHSSEIDPALIAQSYRNFDLGWKLLLGSIVLGTVAEISFAMRRVIGNA